MATARFTPFALDIDIYSGDHTTIPLLWETEDNAGTRTPVDLTSYTVTGCTWRTTRAAATGIALAAAITNAAAGELEITITDTVSETLETRGYYDLELERPDGTPVTLVAGRVSVDGDVHR